MFFGSGLTGVYKVMTSKSDIDAIFTDILDTDYALVKSSLNEIDDIRLDFVVSSDAYNLMMAYLLHRAYTSQYLDNKKKERAMFDIALLMQYKMITGLLAHYFKYPAEERVAVATFNALSNKFLLKKLGNWQEYFNYRAGEIIKDHKFIKEVYTNFDNTDSVIYFINAVYGAIKDVLKNIYREFVKVRENDARLSSRSSTSESESGETLSDVSNNVAKHIENVKRNIHDVDSFITNDAFMITCATMKDLSPIQFREVLVLLCKDSLSKTVMDIVEETVVTVYDMFKHKDYFIKGNDVSAMLIDLKFAIIAKRNHDDPLEKLKVKIEQFIKNKHSGKSDSARRVLRTGVIIFIAIKAFIE
jgi:hypothetical protein